MSIQVQTINPAFINSQFVVTTIIVLGLAIAFAAYLRSAFVEAHRTVEELNKTAQSFASVINSLRDGIRIDQTETTTKHTHIQLDTPAVWSQPKVALKATDTRELWY